MLTKLWHDRSGASLIEYGLLVSLVALASVISLTALGGGINSLFTQITTAL